MEQGRESRTLLDAALQRLGVWRQLLPFGGRSQGFSEEEVEGLMRACLEGRGGEVAARTRAAELGLLYLNLPREERIAFLRLLTEGFDLEADALRAAVAAYAEEPEVESYLTLRQAAQPSRVEILRRLNSLPDGFRFLVELRADLLTFLSEAPGLARLDQDLQMLFESWFDVGLLTFSRITWDSPASLLERIVEYEAVHRIRSWQDLKNRLDADRRCYAFFHPKMDGDPLIFVEVALTQGIPGEIAPLLDEDTPSSDPAEADTAVFYSISNTQAGLRGISFGTFLLKRVTEALTDELPHLKRFVTLSPIPGFRRWLFHGSQAEEDPLRLRAEERERLRPELEARGATVRDLLERPDWAHDPALAQALREPLLDRCADYLLNERKGERPRDPVARFHISNGASLERLSYLGDVSKAGMDGSLGIMANYLYSPGRIERNHESFFRRSEVAASAEVRRRATQRR